MDLNSVSMPKNGYCIEIDIAKHLQQILSLLLKLQINFSSIDVKIASEITLFLDNTGHLQMQNYQKGYPYALKVVTTALRVSFLY